MRGVEAPEERLKAIPVVGTHLFTLLQECRGSAPAFEDLTHLVAHPGVVLDFCGGVEKIRKHLNEVLRGVTFRSRSRSNSSLARSWNLLIRFKNISTISSRVEMVSWWIKQTSSVRRLGSGEVPEFVGVK